MHWNLFPEKQYGTSDRSISLDSVEGDFHNPLTSRCETFEGWTKIVSYPLVFEQIMDYH